MKAFSETEKTTIRKNLIDSCLFCWNKYGFSKTSIGIICEMSKISIGAFYKFFKSKEELFYESAMQNEYEMLLLIDNHLTKEPGKQGLIEGIKVAVKKATNTVWFYKSNIDMPQIMRKLELGGDETFDNIVEKFYIPLFEKHKLKFKKEIKEVVLIIALLFGGILLQDFLKVDLSSGLDFIVESTVNSLIQ